MSNPAFYHAVVLKGNSHNLMKATAKRRRSKRQIEEEKLQAEAEANAIQAKVAAYDQMKQEMKEYEEMKTRFTTMQYDLDQVIRMREVLLEAGILVHKEDGRYHLTQKPPGVD